MRRWAPFVAAYALSAALVLPAVPLAADEQAAPGAQPSAPAPPVSTAPPETAAPPTPAVPADPPDEDVSPPTSPDAASLPSDAPAAPDTSLAPAGPPTAAGPPIAAPPANSAPATVPTPADRKRASRVFARAAAPGSVTIADFSFGPATVTVDVGDSVTWTNRDDVVHTATGSSGGFDTGDIEPGSSGGATFDQAGSFSYICKPHPFMKGTVVVRAASTGGGGDDGATTGSTGTGGSLGSDSVGGADESSGPRLPNTGLDALVLAGLGVLFLGIGALVNRRAAEPPPPGQPGW